MTASRRQPGSRSGPVRFLMQMDKSPWVHPCSSHGTWVLGNESMHRRRAGCPSRYKWRKNAMLRLFQNYLLSPGDKAYLTRIEREVQREQRSSVFLAVEE